MYLMLRNILDVYITSPIVLALFNDWPEFSIDNCFPKCAPLLNVVSVNY